MGKVFNALQLQGVLLLWIICAANGAPYSKYGRSCKDIGCLPREVCIMAYESCSFGQQENSNCGRYPTCKKNTDQAATQQNTGSNLSPVPENARPNTDSSPPRESINPNNVFGYPSSHNIYPQMPPYQIPLDTPRLPDNRQAFPASTNHNGGYVPLYQDGLTPPPNVFGPFRNSQFVTTTKEPSLLDQFLYNKSPRNASTMAMPSLNLTFISLIFLLIYTIRRNLF